jgi:hypothetical protein
MPRLDELCQVLRSKNVSPTEVGFDLVFLDADIYFRVKVSEELNPDVVSRLYNIPVSDIRIFRWFDQASALKISIPRRVRSGSPGDRDLYGAQQHTPLAELAFDLPESD